MSAIVLAGFILGSSLLAGEVPASAPGELAGEATWYPAATGSAAAGPGLRRYLGRDWRGQLVTVCRASSCLVTRVSDWCACSGRRVIDLAAGDFARLAPLSAGVIRVTVSAAGSSRPSATLPPTDAAP